MSLHDLSAELLHAICEVCPKDTLQDLRLTCRKLRDIANEYFCPEVVTCLEREDLARVRAVADCTNDSRNAMKSFTIQADTYGADIDGEHLSRREWLKARATFIKRSNLRRRFYDLDDRVKKQRPAQHRIKLRNALQHYLDQIHAEEQDNSDKSWVKTYYGVYKHLSNAQRELLEDADSSRLMGLSTLTRGPNTLGRTVRGLFQVCPKISAITIDWQHGLRRNAGFTNTTFLMGTKIPHVGQSNMVEEVTEEVLVAAHQARLTIRELAIAGAGPYFMSGFPANST